MNSTEARENMLTEFIRAEGWLGKATAAVDPVERCRCMIFAGESIGAALTYAVWDDRLKGTYIRLKHELIKSFLDAVPGQLVVETSDDPFTPERLLRRYSPQ